LSYFSVTQPASEPPFEALAPLLAGTGSNERPGVVGGESPVAFLPFVAAREKHVPNQPGATTAPPHQPALPLEIRVRAFVPTTPANVPAPTPEPEPQETVVVRSTAATTDVPESVPDNFAFNEPTIVPESVPETVPANARTNATAIASPFQQFDPTVPLPPNEERSEQRPLQVDGSASAPVDAHKPPSKPGTQAVVAGEEPAPNAPRSAVVTSSNRPPVQRVSTELSSHMPAPPKSFLQNRGDGPSSRTALPPLPANANDADRNARVPAQRPADGNVDSPPPATAGPLRPPASLNRFADRRPAAPAAEQVAPPTTDATPPERSPGNVPETPPAATAAISFDATSTGATSTGATPSDATLTEAASREAATSDIAANDAPATNDPVPGRSAVAAVKSETPDDPPVPTESFAGRNVEPPAASHANRQPTTDAGQPVVAAGESAVPDEVAAAAAGEPQPTSPRRSRPTSQPNSQTNVESPRDAGAPATNDSADVASSRTQNTDEPQPIAPVRSNALAQPEQSADDGRPTVNPSAFAATAVSQASGETVPRAADRPTDDGEREAKPQPTQRETAPRGAAELQPAESTPRLQNAENAGKPPADTVQTNAEDVATRFVQRVESALRQAVDRQRGFRVQLHPPELGALSVEIARGASGLALRLVVDNADALQRVNENLAVLQSSLKEHGMSVERIDVHLHRADDPRDDVPQQSADRHDDGRNPGDARDDRRRHNDSPFAADETESSEESSSRPPTHTGDAIDVQI
jgi:flagellar hook-length control protein FliK